MGGEGNDVLRGGLGTDAIDGEAGDDRFSEQGNTNIVINGFVVTSSLLGTDTTQNIERFELTGGSGANLFDARLSSLPVKLSGGTGNDTLLGSAFADDINGGSGDDVLSGGAGQDILNGSSGRDIVYEKANTSFTVNGLRLTSVVTGNEVAIAVEGFALVGGDDDNVLDARLARVAVTLLGGRGNDTLIGSNFNDVLLGGNRADSAAGTDSLTGGLGTDIYDNDPLDRRPTLEANETAIANVFAGLPSWLYLI